MAWAYGDAKKVAYPTDSAGQFCGQKDTRNEEKNFLFYFNTLQCANPIVLTKLQCPTMQFCVKKCPDKFSTFLTMQKAHQVDKSHWEYYREYCKPGFNDPLKPALEVFRDEDCPSVIFPSRSILKRCFPDFNAIDTIMTLQNRSTFFDGIGHLINITDVREGARGINLLLILRTIGMRVFEDFVSSWQWILIGLSLSMVSSLMFLFFLKYTAGIILWFFVFGVFAIIAYGIYNCYNEFHRLHSKPSSQITFSDIGFQADLRVYLLMKQTWLIFVVILCILELLILLLILFLRKRIQIAIALLKEGSRAIGYIPFSLIYPIVTFFLISICLCYWIVTSVFLATSGEAVYKVLTVETSCKYANETCDPKTFQSTNISKECPRAYCAFAFYGGKSLFYQYILFFQLYNIFVFLWLVNFSIALGQCTLAGAFSYYYWSFRKPEDIPPYPVCTSFGRALRYHTGSLAIGALIISTVQSLRVLLEYLDHRLKESQTAAAKFILNCLKYCFWLLEKVLKFINRNAYIMIAMYGEDFFTAAKNAFMLVMRNVLRIAVLDKVTELTLWMGKLFISGGIGVLGFLFFTKKLPFTAPTLNYYWVPLLVKIWREMMEV
ncbi:choline transporter-like protein 5 isoform X2 [Macrotis lagotis]|uniref:choline transporter-like protein 5 isoform X2 n=1 Tax=Macrotis lagotis TaxID=92651 RepID=UPI003D6917C6